MHKFFSIILAFIVGLSATLILSHMSGEGMLPSIAQMSNKSDSTGFIYSDPIEVNGIRFETFVSQQVLPIPRNQPSADPIFNDFGTYLMLGVRITNNTKIPFRFTGDKTIFPQLLNSDNQFIDRTGGSDKGKPAEESDYLLALPGKSVTFFLKGSLFWSNDKLCFNVFDIFGFTTSFESLDSGKYKFRFSYTNFKSIRNADDMKTGKLTPVDGFWTGTAITPFINIYIVKPS
jgi:hypothetical protein